MRISFNVLFVLLWALNVLGADFDYSMSDLGKTCIDSLRQGQEANYLCPILLGIGGAVLVPSGFVPGIVCSFIPFGGCIAPISIVTIGLVSLGGGVGSIAGAIIWAVHKYKSISRPKNQRDRIAHLLDQAYRAKNGDEKEQADALRQIEHHLAEVHPNYKITYASLKQPIETLASQLVLANEAGHFVTWSELFPNQDLQLGEHKDTVGAPKFDFWAIQGKDTLNHLKTDNLVILDIDCLLNSDRPDYLSTEILQNQIKDLRAASAVYEQSLAEKRHAAQEFMNRVAAGKNDLVSIKVGDD